MHVSFAVRPGTYFVHRLLASVGMPRIAAGAKFAGRTAHPDRLAVLGPEFQGDLEFWRWFVDVGLDAQGGTLSAPTYNLLERPAQRTLFSDASKTAIRGYCPETGGYWRFDVDAAERSHFPGSRAALAGENDISNNVLLLLGVVVSAFVSWLCAGVALRAERPSAIGDCVLLRGDSEAAAQWILRCREGKEPRSGAFMLVGISTRNTFLEFFALPPMVSNGGISSVETGAGERRHIPLYFGFDLELMRSAIAPSSDRTYQGHFGDWVEYRVRCGLPVFLRRCGDSMTNVAYAFATKKMPSAIVESLISDEFFPSCFTGLF